MAWYGYILQFPDGEYIRNDESEGDGPYKTFEAARDAAYEARGLWRQGSEIFNMSNPGDYPETTDDDEPEIIIYQYPTQ